VQSPEYVADAMIRLQKRGVYHIGLVTPTPHIAGLIKAIHIAVRKGLHLPIIANTNGYTSIHGLRLLQGIVDIYLPDFKYIRNRIATELSCLPDYTSTALNGIREMYRQVGRLTLHDGLAVKGVLIRHLVLPNNLSGTSKVLEMIHDRIDKRCAISLMKQYFPCNKALSHPLLSRRLSRTEFLRAKRVMRRLRTLWGWVQRD